MTLRRRLLLLSFGIALATLSIDVRSAHASPRAWKDVRRWLVEAESDVVSEGEKTPAIGSLTRRIVAVATDRLVYFIGHPDFNRGIDWRDEPFNLDIRIRGNELVKHYRFNRSVEFREFPFGSVIPDPVRRDSLCFFIPVWPLKGYRAPYIDNPQMILIAGEAFESVYYEQTSERQLIDMNWCTLLKSKNGMDYIWLSDEKDCCVMRRQWYVDPSRTAMGELTVNKISEVAPDLWMPTDVEIVYWSISSTDRSRKQLRGARTRIVRCEIDSGVPADAFDLNLKLGSIERVSKQQMRQLTPGGTEHLTEIATFYRERIGLPQRSATGSGVFSSILQVLLGALAAFLLAMIPLRSVTQKGTRALLKILKC